jgi:hypothetical protein
VNQKETGSVGGSAETVRVLCIDDNVHGISVSSPTEFAQPIFAPDAASLIAKATGVSHPTVAKVRVDLEDGGKIYHHENLTRPSWCGISSAGRPRKRGVTELESWAEAEMSALALSEDEMSALAGSLDSDEEPESR